MPYLAHLLLNGLLLFYTTEEMKKKTGNPDFTYEIACDQICGKYHFTMRGVIIVETQKEFNAWMIKQRPEYLRAKKFLTDGSADSTKTVAVNNHPGK
jgi:cytochrome c oxidase subunit 2